MSTLAEVLCGRVHPLWMSTFGSPCPSCDHLAAVVAEWLTSERVVKVAATHHFCEDYGGCGCCDPELADEFDRELHAKHQLSVLAALAKATCACGEVWGGHPNPHSIVCPAYEKGKTDE